jgi:general secretion pathway protein A
MYNAFFEFQEKPFKLVPNPEFLYLSKSHEIALAHLNYAVEQGDGFVVITGEVGTGKTTLCRNFLERLNDQTETAYIFNPRLNSSELLGTICNEFGITTQESSVKALLDILYDYLILKNKVGRRVILLIDEAQSLTIENLETIRMLSNLETSRNKLLQIFLVGQPELSDTLDSHELRQLAQRIPLACYLAPLSAHETTGYIKHRINIASQRQTELFTSRACTLIHRYSNGIPRLINIAADRCLLTAYSLNRKKITAAIAKTAIKELAGRGRAVAKRSFWQVLGRGIGVAVIVLALAGIGIGTMPWIKRQLFSAGIGYEIKDKPSTDSVGTIDVGPQSNVFKVAETEVAITPPATPPEPVTRDMEAATTLVANAGSNQEEDTAPPAVSTHEAVEPLPQMASLSVENPPAGTVSRLLETEILALEHDTSRFDAVAVMLTQWRQSRPTINQIPPVVDDRSYFEISARQYGLRLYTVESNWALLERLNMPAVIALKHNATPQQVYMTMVGRNGSSVFLVSGRSDQPVQADVNELNGFLSGPTYVFWKNIFGFDAIITYGSHSAAIAAVKTLLRQIGYPLMDTTDFDQGTRNAIIHFQRRHKLDPDGLVGPLTKMFMIIDANAYDVPQFAMEPHPETGAGL